MARVHIDGVEYIPASSSSDETLHRIGVGVTTRNRNEIAAKTVASIRKLTPNAHVVVVDDASDEPFEGADVRFDENVGIARAKNKALELLYDAGCEHIFLLDDDTYPLVEGWTDRYVASREPHLMWVFDKPKGAKSCQVEVLFQDSDIIAYHATRGCMLYVERRVLDVVGGMNPDFGTWGWEHQSWSDRIHAAGLTTARYMDITDSDGLIYSMDKENEIESTATEEAKRFSTGPGLELRMNSRDSDEYIEFRQNRDVVFTTLLTSQADPQRGRPMSSDASVLKALHDSLHTDADFVVATTGLTNPDVLPSAEIVEVTQNLNPYFERWLHLYRYLRDNRDIGFVFAVDGTDVEMTRDPFPEMKHGILYTGYEPTTLRDPWMLKNHPDTAIQEFFAANPNLPLVNMGVVGGDRETVMEFAHAQIKFFFDDHIDFIYGWEHGRVGVGDMGSGNLIAHTKFSDRLSFGSHVTNVFKSNTPSATAWWKHK